MAATTTSGADLARRLERVEAEGYASMWAAAPPELAAHHGIALARLGDVVCRGVASLSGHRYMNQANGLTEHHWPAGRGEEIARFYAGLGAEHVVAVPPFAPAGAVADLRALGYVDSLAWAKFHRGVEDPPAGRGDVPVREAASDPGAFGRIMVAGFGLPDELAGWFAALVGHPGWHTLLALDEGRPIGAGAMFVQGDVAWLGGAATLPSARGRGAQGALMRKRIARARASGCAHVTTETGVPRPGEGPGPSYRNMLRHGFRLAYDRPNLTPAARRVS
jgi:GNAT superfamily N-acetyltransferase